MSRHGLALRAPWYAGLRGGFDRFGGDGDPARDADALAPAVQKYDRDDFVAQLVADPQASLTFDDGDRWTFAMPRSPLSGTTMRERLSTHQLVRTPMRKLYQPAHQRFYAVTIELFCDAPGLPRPSPADDPTVRFVVRRTRTTVAGDAADVTALARAAAKDFLSRDPGDDPDGDVSADVAAMVRLRVAASDEARREAFSLAHAGLLSRLTFTEVLEGWFVGADGRGRWAAVPDADPGPDAPERELELPMWRIPAAGCERARTRSLWFGVVPTFSADLDRAGEPRFDDRATYVLQCVARRPRPAPHAHCPQDVAWSGPGRPYRLAAFFDPAGSAQRPVRVKLPDLRALAAHAAAPRRPGAPREGGVQFERPPGSQLAPAKLGEVPKRPLAKPDNAVAEICSFSIELITIVAMFVLGIFLPIVVFVFQLWWMLMLKFCWPRPADTALLLDTLGGTAIKDLDPLTREGRTLSAMLGVEASTVAEENVLARLGGASGVDQLTRDQSKELVDELAVDTAPEPVAPTPEDPVEDPLC